MLLLRLIAILAVIALGVAALLYLFTGNRRYLKVAMAGLKWALVLALALAALFVLERIIVAV